MADKQKQRFPVVRLQAAQGAQRRSHTLMQFAHGAVARVLDADAGRQLVARPLQLSPPGKGVDGWDFRVHNDRRADTAWVIDLPALLERLPQPPLDTRQNIGGQCLDSLGTARVRQNS